MLSWAKTFCVTFPTPHIFFMRSGSKNSLTLSGGTTVNPSGLSMSDAIFAINLDGATPAETVRPISLKTVAFTSFAISTAPPRRRLEPVTSRNASSMESGSTSGVKRPKISKMLFEISLYRCILPGKNIPFGQRRIAVAMGCAECTPNLRAS